MPQSEQTNPFLFFVYSKSALHRGHARISNNSFGIGSSAAIRKFKIKYYLKVFVKEIKNPGMQGACMPGLGVSKPWRCFVLTVIDEFENHLL